MPAHTDDSCPNTTCHAGNISGTHPQGSDVLASLQLFTGYFFDKETCPGLSPVMALVLLVAYFGGSRNGKGESQREQYH